jgi:dUTP pyrophosphatase
MIQALYQLVNAKPVKVKRDEKAKIYDLIKIKKDGDVGYDLPCTEDMIIMPGERRTVSTGISLEIPEHLWATIEGRSSASRWEDNELRAMINRYSLWEKLKLRLRKFANDESNMPKFHVVTGTIDTGYRGELKAVMINLGEVPIRIIAGERYAQVIFHFRCVPPIEEVDELSKSERGDTGFGSSGK